MDATPWEQDVEPAVALKWTGEETVASLLGAETVTLANAAGISKSEKAHDQQGIFLHAILLQIVFIFY